jgi:type II secretory pathway component HofQ
LGGIYEINHEQDERRIPFLADIPLVGWLFKQQDKLKNKRELLIFVTPRIMGEA